MTSSALPIFKNKLQKQQTISKLSKHRAQLNRIASGSHRYPNLDQTYRQMLQQNPKADYYIQNRNKQIKLQNTSLYWRIMQIKDRKKPSSFWISDRPNMLNQGSKNNKIKQIDIQNKKLVQRILEQKPSISLEKLNKDYGTHLRLSNSISKIQKYKLPKIQNCETQVNSSRSMYCLDPKNQGRIGERMEDKMINL